jgi:hypothetical protein
VSVVTAPALNALSPEQALTAWKGLNSTVRNPLFTGLAFGIAVWLRRVQLLRVEQKAFLRPLTIWCASVNCPLSKAKKNLFFVTGSFSMV